MFRITYRKYGIFRLVFDRYGVQKAEQVAIRAAWMRVCMEFFPSTPRYLVAGLWNKDHSLTYHIENIHNECYARNINVKTILYTYLVDTLRDDGDLNQLRADYMRKCIDPDDYPEFRGKQPVMVPSAID